jgi:DNA-binding transcriptional regulator of glucitol operon
MKLRTLEYERREGRTRAKWPSVVAFALIMVVVFKLYAWWFSSTFGNLD